MSILIFVVILFLLVLVHEFGHYIVAKKSDIRVDEFGFGYPPRALTMFKRGETIFTLNWLPFGGFVKIFGENPDDENTHGPDKKRSFVHKKARVQALVLVAGVVMNFLLAWLLFSIGFMTGLPTSVGSEPRGTTLKDTHLLISEVTDLSPAEKGGLLPGNIITKVTEGDRVLEDPDIQAFRAFILASADKEVAISVIENSDVPEIHTVVPRKNEAGDAQVGIAMDMVGTLKLPWYRSLWEGLKLSVFVTKSIVVSLGTLVGQAFHGTADLNTITGPVGIVKVVGQAYSFGLVYLVSFTAMISLNLAVINLLPFPALDGGRLFFLAIEKISRRKIPAEVLNWANGIGFFFLIGLMLLVTYHDVMKLVNH